MTCKAGREVLCKLAFSSLIAIALMLGTALPARAQANHSTINLLVTTADGNTYGCELTLVTTPKGRANGECTATLISGSGVTEGATFENQLAMQWMEMSMGGMPMTMVWPFGLVDVEETPGSTANVIYHN